LRFRDVPWNTPKHCVKLPQSLGARLQMLCDGRYIQR